MKRILVVLASLALVASLTACAKAPTEEINATKAAVDAAVAEGAQQYTPEDYKVVADGLAAANAEIKIQEDKFFKNFDKAKQQLAKTKADAEALKGKVAERKEELKQAAIQTLAQAAAAVVEAKDLLAKAPKGKGSRADLEAMQTDLAGVEAMLPEVQPMIDGGDFIGANEKANAILARVTAIIDEVKAAQAKVGAR
jgi:dsDNA-specific endonuclease/ATPase MutS2